MYTQVKNFEYVYTDEYIYIWDKKSMRMINFLWQVTRNVHTRTNELLSFPHLIGCQACKPERKFGQYSDHMQTVMGLHCGSWWSAQLAIENAYCTKQKYQ
jgi:hypothetical protein